MTLPAPTIVIFDMDGTVVRHVNPRLLHALEFLDDASFRVSRFFGWVFRRGARGPVIPDLAEWETRRKPRRLVHRALHKVRRKPVEQIVEPCPGVYSVLALLKTRGIPVGLVSNGLGKGYGHDVLDKFGLEPFFSAAIFREDIRKSKPNPEPLLLALRRMNIEPGPEDVVWYIGDRHKDVLAAIAADGAVAGRVIPVAYQIHAALAVLEKGLSPESIIMSYPDMGVVLAELLAGGKSAARKATTS